MSATAAAAIVRAGRSGVEVVRPSTPLTPHHILYKDGHRALQRSITELINRELNGQVEEWERIGRFPAHKVFLKLGAIGAFGVNKPKKFGGLGLDFSYSCAVAEALGRAHCGSIPMASCVQSDMATPALAAFGSASLCAEFLTPSLSGEVVACIAVSEPAAGSDVAGSYSPLYSCLSFLLSFTFFSAIKTTARRTASGDWLLNGRKIWITNGGQADWACILVNTNQKSSLHSNKSLFCVHLNEPGVLRSRDMQKLGMHSSDMVELVFDNVRVPSANIIGEEGRGFVYQMLQFQDERLVTAAVLLEPLQRCIDLTMEYTRERHIFGQPALSNQVIQFRLAELESELEAVRSLLYRAVAERVEGNDVTVLASMAKLKAARLARDVTDTCLQYFGASGFMWQHPVSRLHRDLRAHSIGAGADEVMLAIVAKEQRRRLHDPL